MSSPSLLQGTLSPGTKFPETPQKPLKPIPKKEDKAAWFKLFAELDPLANPDSIPGSSSSQSHAA